MARLLKRPSFINRRLLFICFGSLAALPATFVVYVFLALYVAPLLLNLDNAIATNIGLRILYPSLAENASNSRCKASLGFEYFYFCRFNMTPLEVEQFAKERRLDFTNSTGCDLLHGRSPQEHEWWKPLDLVEAQCYSESRVSGDVFMLLYSPTAQLVYMHAADF